MAGSGSEKRKRKITLKARFTEQEAALVREQAARAGVSVGSVIRYGVLEQAPLRASRQPTINEETAARLLGMLGQHVSALRSAAASGSPSRCDDAVEASYRDAPEMRVLWFQAFGREP